MTSAEQAALADNTLSAPTAARTATRILGPIAVCIALLSALVTFAVLSNLTAVPPTNEVVRGLLLTTLATAILLVGVIGWEVWQIVLARRRGRAAARLHVRIVALFSLIAAAPAVLVAIVASVTLDRGLDQFLSNQTRSLMDNALMVSQVYVREHARAARADIIAMATDISRAKPLFDTEPERFKQFFTAQATFRGMPSAELLRADLTSVAKATVQAPFDVRTPSSTAVSSAGEQEPQIALSPDGRYVAAVIKVRGYDDLYLYITRTLDPRVIAQLAETQTRVSEYSNLQARRLGVQVAFALMYTVIALIVLLSAVWVGLNFANRLVAPIRRLIGAANIVSTGNLHVQVPIRKNEGDLGQLGETFNKMTQELRTQRDDIVSARDLIDSRRRFTEAVLAGASAGVIGVEPNGNISILNRSAEKLIGCAEIDVLGQPLGQVVPELDEILTAAHSGAQRLVQGQVTLNRRGRERNLSVRVTTEQTAKSEHGYVVTLDDITELVLAQRSSAWADIARRIAHEIKNPLTPIQLSAERLRRKYRNIITEDRAIFEQCTDTIIRQVDDIKGMVDEFSRFARMPKPVIAREDVAEIVRQAVFLQKVGNAEIDIDVEIAEDPMLARIDRRLISQALTNIVKNATEAIAARPPGSDKGRIRVSVGREDGNIFIDVIDNGIGLPKENRNRLLEPYVTTREKGTGLGLAIVGRILEEHGGGIELNDAADAIPGQQGAWMRLWFHDDPVIPNDASEPAMQSAAPGGQ
jgi:two-component system nitrogen regulation sensor histidine kinase NtrY